MDVTPSVEVLSGAEFRQLRSVNVAIQTLGVTCRLSFIMLIYLTTSDNILPLPSTKSKKTTDTAALRQHRSSPYSASSEAEGTSQLDRSKETQNAMSRHRPTNEESAKDLPRTIGTEIDCMKHHNQSEYQPNIQAVLLIKETGYPFHQDLATQVLMEGLIGNIEDAGLANT